MYSEAKLTYAMNIGTRERAFSIRRARHRELVPGPGGAFFRDDVVVEKSFHQRCIAILFPEGKTSSLKDEGYIYPLLMHYAK